MKSRLIIGVLVVSQSPSGADVASINPQPEDDGPPRLPSAWQVFLAIARYSSLEPNLNAKRLLENAAESVLVIPPRMYEVLDQLQSS